MLSFFLSSIPIIGKVVDAFNSWAQKKLDTKLEMYKVDGKIDSNIINAEVQILRMKAELLKNRWLVAMQVGFGLPLMVYYGKCILWDKVFGWGVTDALTGEIATYSNWIVAFLFLHSGIMALARK
jgi:hypothetical protein